MNILTLFQIIISVVLIGLILLQSGQGGLQAGFGGEFYRTKRGAERLVFAATIVTAGLFFLVSLLNLAVS